MRKRREITTPNNPKNFSECIEFLLGAPVYNKYLQKSIWEEGEGALIFATPKGLSMANSEGSKVAMTDAWNAESDSSATSLIVICVGRLSDES